MKKKITVLFLCSVILATGLGIYKNVPPRKTHPKAEAVKNAPGNAEPGPLSSFSDADLMKESS
jgi:hypothetical protein